MADFELILQNGAPHIVAFDLQMDWETCRAADPSLQAGDELPKARLFEIDLAHDILSIYPLRTIPSSRFLKPKYSRIRSISVELPSGYEIPSKKDEAHSFLRTYLPAGFVYDPVFGLGLMKEIRPIIAAIEKIHGVEDLEISNSSETTLQGSNFVLSRRDYEELRLAFQRIARQYQAESLADRNVLAHNSILHKLLPQRFPAEERPYKPGTVYKLLGGGTANTVTLRGNDRKSAAAAVGKNARNIADSDADAFMQLQRDIEMVALDKLIDGFRLLLSRNHNEIVWQKLFELNPFILSMVFGYPVVLVQAGASVGGLTIQGDGNKIADFLLKNEGTHNAALVEIKKPHTPLFSDEYRVGVWNPSKDVTGAIVQVLDQRQRFVTNLAAIKHNSGLAELQGHSVDCVIVVGRTPNTPEQKSSLELIRAQLKDVRLVTFDELLGKLILLRDLLSSEHKATDEGGGGDELGASNGDGAGGEEPTEPIDLDDDEAW